MIVEDVISREIIEKRNVGLRFLIKLNKAMQRHLFPLLARIASATTITLWYARSN
jgi:hypothetical protein